MQEFNTDKEIKEYIEGEIDSIQLLDECRLYREEQYRITEEVMQARNSTEWIIRINKVIKNFTYAIIHSYEYAKKMESPLEETENSQMYSYYLEDAVYRDIVLWDLLRQYLNEFYQCGFDLKKEISIFAFLKKSFVKRKIGNKNVGEIKRYLESKEHQEVREKLRNQFTHSLDGTSSYIFHRVSSSGKLQADMENVFPNHPYENIVYVLDDVKKYLEFAEFHVNKLRKFVEENNILVTINCNMKCGKVKGDDQLWSINILKEKAEQILVPCEVPCEHAIEYERNKVCKPISLTYCRINENTHETKMDLHMNYKEMEEKFMKKRSEI